MICLIDYANLVHRERIMTILRGYMFAQKMVNTCSDTLVAIVELLATYCFLLEKRKTFVMVSSL